MKTKYILGALALLLSLCVISSAAVINSDDANTQSDVTLGAGAFTGGTNMGSTSDPYTSVNCFIADIVGSSSDYSKMVYVAVGSSVSITTSNEYGNATSVSVTSGYGLSYSSSNYLISGTISQAGDIRISANLMGDMGYVTIRAVTQSSSVTEYTVTFDKNGGTIAANFVSSYTVEEGTSLRLPSTYIGKIGHTLAGWRLGSTSGTLYSAGATYTPTANVTFYADWSANSYTITFDSNGGSSSNTTRSAAYGSSVTLPTSAGTKDGYTFTGWNTNPNGTGTHYNAGTSYTVTEARTLYAEWEEIIPDTYTISYDSNGGTGSISSVSVVQSETIYLSDGSAFSRNGHILTSWNTKADGSGTSYSLGTTLMVTSDVTLYAQWTAVNADTVDPDAPTEGKIGEAYTYTPVYYSSGYKYNQYWGLYCEVVNNSAWSIIYSGPEWLTLSHTNREISFSGTPDESGTYYVSVQLDGPSTAIENASLISWTITVPSNAPDKFTVTYDSNGASGTVSAVEGELNTAITMPSANTLSKSGYVFVGWNTEADGSGNIIYLPGAVYTIKQNITFYAMWDAGDVAFYFHSNGGSGDYIQACDLGAAISLPSTGFTKDGHTLMGWTVNSTVGTVYLPDDLYTVSDNTIFYAAWLPNDAASHKVTFSPGSGTGITLTVDVRSGTVISLLQTGRFTLEGATQTGWNTAADGSGNHYDAGGRIAVTADVTYYAEWETSGSSDSYTVTFIASGSAYTSQTVASGSTVSQPALDPKSPGKIFSAWTLNGQPYDFSRPVTSNLTLVAAFDEHYSVVISQLLVTFTLNSQFSEHASTVKWTSEGDYEEFSGLTASHTYEESGTYTISVRSEKSGSVVESTYTVVVSETSAPGADNFKITYNGNDIIETDSVLVVSGAEVTLPSPSADGYTFKEWNTAADGSGTAYKAGDKITITSDLTLYAVFEEGQTLNYDYLTLILAIVVVVIVLAMLFWRD